MAHDADSTASDPDRDVEERLTRFSNSRNPRDLWPRLSPAESLAAHAAIERVVRRVLAGESRVPLGASGPDALYALTVAGYSTGTGPLLGRWIEDGRVEAQPAVREAFARHLAHGRRRAARLERGLLPAFDALLARGITPVVIKGLHLALAYYDEPGVRPMSDVDIVVPPAVIADAEAALESAGFRPRPHGSLRPYKRDWVAGDVDPRVFSVEHFDARSRWHLELHESFDRAFPNEANAHLDGERTRVAPFSVAGRTVHAPAQPLAFLVSASQQSSEIDKLRLIRIIDVVRMIRADRANGTLDWGELRETLRRTDSVRFVYPAMAMAEELAPGTVDERVLASARSASGWAVRYTVRRLAPGGQMVEGTNIVTMFMWSRGPIGVLSSALSKVLRNTLSKDLVVKWRALLRQLFTGTLAVRPTDQRGKGSKD